MVRVPFSLVVAFFALAISAFSVTAQELDPGGEDEAPVVSTEDVRAALEELIGDDGPDPEAARTTDRSDIEIEELNILLEPLTLGELSEEMAGWSVVLRDAVQTLSEAELELFAFNEEQETNAENETGNAGASAEDTTVSQNEALIRQIAELRDHRTGIADRFRAVMEAFEAKGGDPAETEEYRAFISEVGGVRVDTRNLRTTVLTIREWAMAEDGGQRIVKNVTTVAIAAIAGWGIGWLIGVLLNLGLRTTNLSSKLLRQFVRKWAGYLGLIVGLLAGLNWIGTNMTPILAGLGALGFILAFALQNTISNFASGLLILFQEPFDAGDEIEAAGIVGVVDHVSLFTTHLSTAENRKVIVPNNMIWEDVLVNSTGAPTRRLSIEVEVNAAEHGVEDSEEILMGVMNAHPDVLNDPQPKLTLSALTGESLTFTCWPWVSTENKDRVRWELVSRFGKELTVLKGVAKAGG